MKNFEEGYNNMRVSFKEKSDLKHDLILFISPFVIFFALATIALWIFPEKPAESNQPALFLDQFYQRLRS
jgi:hypothetical protein